MVDTTPQEVAVDQIDELARQLYFAANPASSVLREAALSRWWRAEDEVTRLYWRRQAQQRLAAGRYTKSAKLL